jgi:hypothetical protein
VSRKVTGKLTNYSNIITVWGRAEKSRQTLRCVSLKSEIKNKPICPNAKIKIEYRIDFRPKL